VAFQGWAGDSIVRIIARIVAHCHGGKHKRQRKRQVRRRVARSRRLPAPHRRSVAVLSCRRCHCVGDRKDASERAPVQEGEAASNSQAVSLDRSRPGAWPRLRSSAGAWPRLRSRPGASPGLRSPDQVRGGPAASAIERKRRPSPDRAPARRRLPSPVCRRLPSAIVGSSLGISSVSPNSWKDIGKWKKKNRELKLDATEGKRYLDRRTTPAAVKKRASRGHQLVDLKVSFLFPGCDEMSARNNPEWLAR
jgi:hypothetical protein